MNVPYSMRQIKDVPTLHSTDSGSLFAYVPNYLTVTHRGISLIREHADVTVTAIFIFRVHSILWVNYYCVVF